MINYEKMYFTLFHATESVLDKIDKIPGDLIEKWPIYEELQQAQQACEDIYVESFSK